MIIALEDLAHKSRLNGDFWKWRTLRRAFTVHPNFAGAYDTNVTENERELYYYYYYCCYCHLSLLTIH